MSADNTLHDSGRIVEKGILLQIKKVPEASDRDLTCYVFRLTLASPIPAVFLPLKKKAWISVKCSLDKSSYQPDVVRCFGLDPIALC